MFHFEKTFGKLSCDKATKVFIRVQYTVDCIDFQFVSKLVMSHGEKIDMDSDPHLLVQASPLISVVIVIIISLFLSL